jgi:ArsR family transcriptional regulator
MAVNEQQAAARAEVLKTLAHPVRILIVDELSRGERCACEILPKVGVDVSVLSRHVGQLRRAGIVSERREGVRRVLKLECPCILQALTCAVGVLKSQVRAQARALGEDAP